MARSLFATLGALALGLGGCRHFETPTTAPATTEPVRLTLVATMDVHGWVHGQTESFNGVTLRAGGFAALSGYLKILREENPGGVLLVDAGDLFQGTLIANLTEGSAVIDSFNALRYDVAAIGNHEFDYGPEGPATSPTRPDMDPFGALKARIRQARFPMVSTNIYEIASGQRPAWLPGDGTVVVERKGIKIGLVGLTTPQTPSTTMPINVSSLRFAGLAQEAMTAAKGLREAGVDVVLAVMHAGGKCDSWADPFDLSTCDVNEGEVFSMLRAIPKGTLDGVVAGHTHAVVGHYVNGTPVVENAGLGKFFSVIEWTFDPKTRRIVPELTKLEPSVAVCAQVDVATGSCDLKKLRSAANVVSAPAKYRGKTVVVDTAIDAMLAPALTRVADLQNRPLGVRAPATLGRNYEDESPLGSALADALKEVANADVALVNPGGLRADLKAGDLTYGAVYEVMPFDNAVAVLTLSGAELLRLLDASYAARKGVFQIAGLDVTLNRCSGPSRFLKATLSKGRAIDLTATYRVAMPDFLARGGDGLGAFLKTVNPERVDLGHSREKNFRDALVAYWEGQKRPLTAPARGRIRFEGDAAQCRAPAIERSGP